MEGCIELWFRTAHECVCDLAQARLVDVRLIGRFEVSLWVTENDFGEASVSMKLKHAGSIRDVKKPISASDLPDLMRGMAWVESEIRERVESGTWMAETVFS